MDEIIISFTPAQMWGWLLAVCGGVTVIAGAVAVIIKIIQTAKKPNDDQNERIAKLEERVAKHDELFSKDNDRLEVIENGNRVTQRALLALLDHGLDGNNVEQMRKAKEDLQQHLIER